MKKIIHKNQVVITTLAVLIAIAGYVSYDRKSGGAEETKTVANMKEDALSDGMEGNYIAADISDGESMALASTESGEEPTDAGETVLTSAVAASADYAAQVKLNREQVRSKNKETLLEIINNTSIAEAQKQDAIDSMIQMTDVAERENAAEILLEAKGFSDVVVSITDNEADVVLNMGDVTDAKRAQVEDIVKRKTGISAENIVITPLSQ